VPVEQVETLVIGGGQAGLTMSHSLSRRGRPHLVLEQGRIAERWRSQRWDSLRFQLPNWSIRLPDFPFPHADPDGFAPKSEIIDYLAAYAAFVAAPVRCGVTVKSLRRHGGESGFVAETSDGAIEAENVVVATGPYHRPVVPDVLRDEAGIFQVHAGCYLNPGQLPPGAVLVVGCGPSGAQIAEELFCAGRRVFLSLGRHVRVPRRYRGRDIIWWMSALGRDQIPVEERGPLRLMPVISGAYGGQTIDFRRFAIDGMTLLGRVTAARDGVVEIAADLADSLAQGDVAYRFFLALADAHIAQHGLDFPQQPEARTVLPDSPCIEKPLRFLDLRAEGIGAVIWATGYVPDFSWIDIPVLGPDGEPLHRRGVSVVPGLYFLGLQWLSTLKSSFLSGVGDDAAVLADHIAARR
jgi:putative flavoprotein involved in K+ transport